MNCPHCGSLVVLTRKDGNNWFSCGSANRFRSQSCIDREQLFRELQAAKARIEALEKAGDVLDNHIACGCGVDGPCKSCRNALAGCVKAKNSK